MTYECAICLNVNHASRFQCQTCGTIPAMYSVLHKPIKGFGAESYSLVPVVIANGCERAEHGHTRKVYFRTVPADYYAS